MHQEDQGRSNGWGLRLLARIDPKRLVTPYCVSTMDDLIIQHKRNWTGKRCADVPILGDFA